jgi:serine/threonine protein kinase
MQKNNHKLLDIGYTFKKQIIRNDYENEYQVLSVIATGQRAVVYEIKNTETRVHYAGKVLMKETASGLPIEMDSKEERFLELVTHENVIKYCDILEDELCMVIVFEYYKNGSLKQLLDTRKTLSEVEIKYYGI